MLTPKEIEDLRYKTEHLLDNTINFIYEDIIRVIKSSGRVPDRTAYNLLLLSSLGQNNEVIFEKISDSLKISVDELKEIIETTASKTYIDDIKRITGEDVKIGKIRLKRLTKGIIKTCSGDIKNLTKTLGFITAAGKFSPLTEVYRTVSGEAFKAVASGALSYDEAVLKAAAPLISSGIKTIDYASGVVTDVRAAIRRNVMDSIGRLTNQISEDNFKQLGCDGWEISAHAACAPDHEWIQGRQFKAEEWEKLDASLKRHIGTLNCGHIKFPIIIGKSKPVYDKATLEQYKSENKKGVDYDGTHYTTYEATQKQRQIERLIRRSKEKTEYYEMLGAPGAKRAEMTHIYCSRLSETYRDFCRKTGLKPQYNRLKID